MKVLILVLSATKECYGPLMQVQQETWDSVEHQQTETVYYIGKGQSAPGNIFVSRDFDEELEQISPRTMEAFEYSLNLDWDMMARTHSSTYVHKKNLVDYIETGLPAENLCCGLVTTGDMPFLWGGGSFIFSRDVIEKFVANKDRWNRFIMEDNGITDLARELEIPLNDKGRMCSINEVTGGYFALTYGVGESFNFVDWPDINKAQPHFYFRCKQDQRRDQDIHIMRQLKEHYD